MRHGCKDRIDLLVRLVEERQDIASIVDADRREIEVQPVLPVGLLRLELRLIVAQLDVPAVARAEWTIVAGDNSVVAFLEGIELVGLRRVGGQLVVVVFDLEFAAQLSLFAVRVDIEGAEVPRVALALLETPVACPRDVRGLALVRSLRNRGERGFGVALAVGSPLDVGLAIAVVSRSSGPSVTEFYVVSALPSPSKARSMSVSILRLNRSW